MALTSGKLKGVQVEAEPAPVRSEDPQQTLIALENDLLAGDVSKQTHDVITARLQDAKITRRKLDDPVRSPNISMIEGLLLGSPEFQRR